MKILLATDGSDTARAAVDFLVGFPLPPESEVMVMTVIKEVLYSEQLQQLTKEQREEFDSARADAEAEVRQLLGEEARRLRQAGLVADSRVCSGPPAEEIVRLASESQCELIVVGSHGLGGARRFLLGSVSDRVFEYAPCSVLIVKQPGVAGENYPAADEKWRFLLAYDDSLPAKKAVELCASLPLQSRAEIKAITVLPMIRMYRQDIRQRLSWIWQEKKRGAEVALQWAAAELADRKISVDTELIEEPSAPQAILDAATAFSSDLVVVGHKGKNVFERFLLGSVTARIAHHADCSVLSVRDRP